MKSTTVEKMQSHYCRLVEREPSGGARNQPRPLKQIRAEKRACQRNERASTGSSDRANVPHGNSSSLASVSPPNPDASNASEVIQSDASVDRWFQILVSEYDKNQLRSLKIPSPLTSLNAAADQRATSPSQQQEFDQWTELQRTSPFDGWSSSDLSDESST
jgi:hypothetical protein